MQKEYFVGDHVMKTHHVAFFVADLEESVQFYQEVFGMEVLYYGVVEIANERLAMLKYKDLTLELLWVPTHTLEELRDKYLQVDHHMAFQVDDIEETKRLLLKHPKVTCEEAEIRNVPNLGGIDMRVTFFRGINGERFEIMQDVTKR
jgi:catechol 2,3-dioxygenase-like lactoylglutathione lyase family enzyme